MKKKQAKIQGQIDHDTQILQILEETFTYANTHNVPIIDNPTREYLEGLLLEKQPKYCLEIGSAIGYSSICIARQIEKRGGKLSSCEYSYPSYMKALDAIYSTGLLNIILYYGDFLKFSADLWQDRFDFVFIDGRKERYIDFYKQILPFLADGATLIFDDVIEYADKTHSLIRHLEENKIDYTRTQLSNTDGVLTLTHKISSGSN